MSLAMEARKLLDRGLGVPLVALLRAVDAIAPRRNGSGAANAPAAGDPWDAPAAAIERVLAIKLWGIGNLAMVLPLLGAVRARYPRARIDLLTLESNRALAEACPWIDSVVALPHDGWVRPVVALVRATRGLRRRRYDLVLDFEQFLRASAIVAKLCGARRTVGFATAGQARHGAFDIHVKYRDGVEARAQDGRFAGRHMSQVFGDVVRAAGIPTAGAPPLFVPRSGAAAARVDRLLAGLDLRGRPLVVLHAGSGDNFAHRRWPAERFAKLADLLHRGARAHCAFTGTDAEHRLVARCRAACGVQTTDLAGRLAVSDLVELLARADLLVSNDTAPVHLASALGVPVVALYGPNRPDLYGPLSPRSRAFHSGLACSPCIKNTNAKTSWCRKPLCMESLDPLRVAAAALALLEARAASPRRFTPTAHRVPAAPAVNLEEHA